MKKKHVGPFIRRIFMFWMNGAGNPSLQPQSSIDLCPCVHTKVDV